LNSASLNERSILVIDSGVGGLTICQSILAFERSLQLVYFADDAFFPYGLLDEDLLTQRLHKIVSAMLKLHQPDLVVLACNTVSTLVLPELRRCFDVPFVGVVPAIKPAAQLSKTKRIGLLATPATVCRSYTDDLIADFASDCQVVRVGSNDLVVQAENLLSGKPLDVEVISMALSEFSVPLGQGEIDTIILGCTHFPLLKEQLELQIPGIKWVDSGTAVAKVSSLPVQQDH